AQPANGAAVLERAPDVAERLRRQPLAREYVRDAGGIGRQRLGGDAVDGLLDRHRFLRAEERLARGHGERPPARWGLERAPPAATGAVGELLDRGLQAADQP